MNTWNRVLTVYNHYENPLTGAITWYRHNVLNCFLKNTNNVVTVGGVKLQSDQNIVRIPKQANYVPPYDWKDIPNDKMGEYFTLQPNDIVVFGKVADDIDEYTAGKRSTDLLKKYEALGTMKIKAVNVNTTLPKPHYLILGE